MGSTSLQLLRVHWWLVVTWRRPPPLGRGQSHSPFQFPSHPQQDKIRKTQRAPGHTLGETALLTVPEQLALFGFHESQHCHVSHLDEQLGTHKEAGTSKTSNKLLALSSIVSASLLPSVIWVPCVSRSGAESTLKKQRIPSKTQGVEMLSQVIEAGNGLGGPKRQGVPGVLLDTAQGGFSKTQTIKVGRPHWNYSLVSA